MPTMSFFDNLGEAAIENFGLTATIVSILVLAVAVLAIGLLAHWFLALDGKEVRFF